MFLRYGYVVPLIRKYGWSIIISYQPSARVVREVINMDRVFSTVLWPERVARGQKLIRGLKRVTTVHFLGSMLRNIRVFFVKSFSPSKTHFFCLKPSKN